jgi:hypothetical protein
MSPGYVSLAAVAQNMDIYERLPVRIQGALRESIRNTGIANLISVPLLLIALATQPHTAYDFFSIIDLTANAAMSWFTFAQSAAEVLLIFNLVSLLILGLVMALSSGMTEPVDESVHWLAWAGAIASAISLVSAVTIAIVTVALFILTGVLWCCFGCAVLVGLLGALGALGGR